jgi:outer membrane receptor protein involved in Fe transport
MEMTSICPQIRIQRWIGLLLLVMLTVAAAAEAQLTRGTISGTVTDASGAVLPGARVTITNQDTGLVRSATASDDGLFRAPALEPGVYTVRFELDGFQTVENKNIAVKTSDEVTLNIALAVGSLAEQVQVSAESGAATLNKTNPTIGFTAGARLVTNLPPGNADRDINRLALLSPNVVTAPGSTTISVNGQRARNNNFTIDGTDNNDVSVTISTLDIVPEAVAEFQVQTNAYNVEFGRNSGGQFNVITKSGTNTLHGEAWDYYRGSRLNARDNLEKGNNLAEPTRGNRNQFGGGSGGPIVRNRMFFYGLMQADRARNAGALQTTIRMPTPAGFGQLSSVPLGSNQTAASRQAVLDRIGFLRDLYALNPTFTSVQTTLVNGVPIETGQTNFGLSQPNDTWNTFGRTDVQITPSNNLTVRYIMNKSDDTNSGSNLNVGERFASDTATLDQNTAVSHTRILSSTLLNEARFAFIRRNLDFPENDPNSPTATIGGGFFTIGGLSNFPQGRVQDHYQFSNVLSNQRGRHALKMGADIRYVRLDNISAFDSKGTFTFNNFQDYMNNLAVSFTQALQTSSFFATQWQSFLFAQDDFKVTPDLTLNLGLRYELSTVPLGFFGATEQQVIDALVPRPPARDTNNWAPRVGFAWSPSPERGLMRKLFGDGDGVIRGGFGISYDVLFYNILVVNASNYPRVITGRVDNAQNIYPNLAPVTGAAVFNPLAQFVNTPEDAENPSTRFWSLSIQRQLASHYTVEIGYTGNMSRNGINQLQGNPATLSAAQAATVVATGSITSIPVVQARRDFPNIGSRVLIATTSKGEYHAGYVSMKRRFSRGLEAGASYTFGKLMSDNDESLGVAAITNGSPQIPQDYRNIDAEWGLSAFDRKHRLVAHWLYEMPRLGSGFMDRALGGWQLSGVFQAQSGQPFTIVTGVDSNGNGGGGDRPNFNAAGTLTPDPDTGNLRTFTTSNMFLAPRGSNGLPLAFSLGNGDLGRNTLRAASWFNWDLSLAKRFRLFSSHSVVIRGDFLNAFNQDNYGIPVNSLNNASFGQNIQNWGNRTVTLSAKYSF